MNDAEVTERVPTWKGKPIRDMTTDHILRAIDWIERQQDGFREGSRRQLKIELNRRYGS